MKFSIATLSLAVASVKATSFNLRSQQKAAAARQVIDNDRLLDSEVILKGTKGTPTAEDLEFIGKALVASYNDVHWEVGHYMTGSHAVDFKGPDSFLCNHCPDDDSMGGAVGAFGTNVFSVQTPVGFLCNHCPDDDAMGGAANSMLMAAITNDCAGLCKKDASPELEVNFCNRIQTAQGSAYLSSAKACAIRFDADNETIEPHQHVQVADQKVATLDTTIILKGVAADKEVNQGEQAILAKAFVSAYNYVHWSANHYLSDAEIPFVAATDPSGFLCNHCPDDDSMGGQVRDTNTLVFNIVTPVEAFLCNHCPDDDAMGSQFDTSVLTSNAFDKKAVEVAFCKKLQKSPSTKLASAKSCSLAVETVVVDNKNNKWM